MATLQQIAFQAGCSLATVSRVLNGEGPVSDEMVRRVRRAAAELGYRRCVAALHDSRLKSCESDPRHCARIIIHTVNYIDSC